jgi:hypothetical protein
VRTFSLLASVCVLGFSCMQVVDTDALDQGCPDDQKDCYGECVSRQNPDYGCAADGCRPCVIANATAHCGATGSCIVASCRGDFLDCNHDGDRASTDGCEVDGAHDPLHCGSCTAKACTVSNGTPGCAGGRCAIALCNDGYRDCDQNSSNGCEEYVESSAQNCGHCRNVCAPAQTCFQGICQD